MVSVKITGMKDLITYLNEVPNKVSESLSQSNHEFISNVKKSAIKYAPEDTGRLKKSIKISKTKEKNRIDQWKLEVGSPYGIFQEFGFKPHAILTDPGMPGFATNKLPLGQVIVVKKWTPFIQPAFDHHIRKLNNKLNKAVNKALGVRKSEASK